MKIVLIFLIAGFNYSTGFSQKGNTKDLEAFIRSQGNFVFLKEKNALPQIVNDYLPEIIKAIRKKILDLKTLWC